MFVSVGKLFSIATMYYLLKTLLALSITLPLLATTTVVLRFYSRRMRKQALLADDWLIVLALVSRLLWHQRAALIP